MTADFTGFSLNDPECSKIIRPLLISDPVSSAKVGGIINRPDDSLNLFNSYQGLFSNLYNISM